MRDKKPQSIALSHLAASFKHLLGGVFKKDSSTSDVGIFSSFFILTFFLFNPPPLTLVLPPFSFL